jgi:CRISPR-associated protein Cas1
MIMGRGVAEVPDLIPARMVNEFTYCPRLFFLECVQARFADNEYTVEGRYQHRVVDKEKGAAPLPGDGDIASARSVMLSSPDLGLVARIDVIEGDAGAVVPVDVKRGSPPANEDRSWEPERVQLCVQGLILRDAGYRCEKGILYFAETRQRVHVPFTDELTERVLGLLKELRAVAVKDLSPPPLVDSPKCPPCSLVGICLPDEINTLSARATRTPRRFLPRDIDPRPVYVTEQGASVGVRDGRLEVGRKGERLASVRLIDVSQLCLMGNVQVSSQAMRQFFSREIPVCWFTYGGWFSGIAEGLPSKHVELRRRQVALAHQGNLVFARKFVEGKIRNSRTLLRRNARQPQAPIVASLKRLAEQSKVTTSISSLLGIEGTAARLYFEAFPTMIVAKQSLPGEGFTFDGRNRRPPRDPVNCLLSFVYALLVKDLTALTYAIGFDPYLGFYHRPRFGRPALALDLAEEFRHLVGDSTVLSLINNGEIKTHNFNVRAGGVALTSDGRRAALTAYERRLQVEIRHPLFGYKVSYRRVMEVQARILAAAVLGEIDAYEPLVTR